MESAFSKKSLYDKIFKTVFVVLLLSSLTAGVTLVTNKDNPTIRRMFAMVDQGTGGGGGGSSSTSKNDESKALREQKEKKAKEDQKTNTQTSSTTSKSSSNTTPQQPSASDIAKKAQEHSGQASPSQSSSSTSPSSSEIGCSRSSGGICREFTTTSGITYYSNNDGTYTALKKKDDGSTEIWRLDSNNQYIKGTDQTINKPMYQVMLEMRQSIDQETAAKSQKENSTIACGGGASSAACFCTQSSCFWNDINGQTHQVKIGSTEYQELMTILNQDNQKKLGINVVENYSRLGIDTNGDNKIDQPLDSETAAKLIREYNAAQNQDQAIERQKMNLIQSSINQYNACTRGGSQNCERFLSNPETFNYLVSNHLISYEEAKMINKAYALEQYLKDSGLSYQEYKEQQTNTIPEIVNPTSPKTAQLKNSLSNIYPSSSMSPTSPKTAQLKDLLSNIYPSETTSLNTKMPYRGGVKITIPPEALANSGALNN